jgi:hypothetical protein
MEKYDVDLHSELNTARKILLRIMNEEVRFLGGGFSIRLTSSAFDHIFNLSDDLSDIERTSLTFIRIIFSKFPFLGHKIKDIAWKLADIVKDDEISLSMLLTSYAEFAKSSYNEYPELSYKFAQKVLGRFNRIHSTNRLVLLQFAYSLTRLTTILFYSKEKKANLKNKAVELMNEICKEGCEDALCLYAKSFIFPHLDEVFFADQELERFKSLMRQAEKAFNSLKEWYSIDRSILNWLRTLYLDPELQLIFTKAHLLSTFGNLLYYSDDLSEAAKKHDEAIEAYRNLRNYTGYFSNCDSKAVDSLLRMLNDEQFKASLEEMSKVDKEVFVWLTEHDERLAYVDSSTIRLLNLHGVMARAALNSIYSQSNEIDGKMLDLRYTGISNCVIYGLQKITKGNSDLRELAKYSLQYLSAWEYSGLLNILIPTLALFQMLENCVQKITIPVYDNLREFTLVGLRKHLINELDKLKTVSCQIYAQIYDDNTDNGLFMQAISSMLYIVATKLSRVDAFNLLITIHLVNDNLEESLLLLLERASQSRMPLLKRLNKEMAEMISKYMQANSVEKEVYTEGLAKAFLRLWYWY